MNSKKPLRGMLIVFVFILMLVIVPLLSKAILSDESMPDQIPSAPTLESYADFRSDEITPNLPLHYPPGTLTELLEGITVGESRSVDVRNALGEPHRIKAYPNGKLYEYSLDETGYRLDMTDIAVGFVDDVMVQIAVPARYNLFGEVHLEEFIAEYGEPDYVTWNRWYPSSESDAVGITKLLFESTPGAPGRRSIGQPGSRAAFFLDDGVLLIVRAHSELKYVTVSFMIFYEPCSLDCAIAQYSDSFLGNQPPPNRTYKEGEPRPIEQLGDDLPEDPWGFGDTR
jgi:hypothetical protein